MSQYPFTSGHDDIYDDAVSLLEDSSNRAAIIRHYEHTGEVPDDENIERLRALPNDYDPANGVFGNEFGKRMAVDSSNVSLPTADGFINYTGTVSTPTYDGKRGIFDYAEDQGIISKVNTNMATDSQTIYQREAPEIEALKIGLMQQARGLTGAPPTGGLPSLQVSPLSSLEQQAASLAESGIGGYQPYLQTGADTLAGGATATDLRGAFGANMAAGATQGFDPSTGIAAYMNPYQSAITDEINRAYDIQRSQLGQQQAQAGVLGGSRAALMQSELDRNRLDALAKAQAQGFFEAQKAAITGQEAQQKRQLQAGLGIGQLGALQGKTLGDLGVRQAALGELDTKLGMQDVSMLQGIGGLQRDVAQKQLEADRQTQLQNIYEPYQRLSFYSDILRGAPSTQQTLSLTSAPQPSLLNQLVGGAATGLGLYGAANKTGII